MKYIHFYAFGEDILEVLNTVEAELKPVRFPAFLRRKKTLGFWFDKLFNPKKAVRFSQSVLQYVPTGNFTYQPCDRYDCGAELPDLGVAEHTSATLTVRYLVTGSGVAVKTRIFRGNFGTRYAIDQLMNNESVIFHPAGLCNNTTLLAGSITTISDTDFAQYLMKSFHKVVKKRFIRIQAYWVGPRAHAFWQAGGRLTIAEQSAPEFDLKDGTS